MGPDNNLLFIHPNALKLYIMIPIIYIFLFYDVNKNTMKEYIKKV